MNALGSSQEPALIADLKAILGSDGFRDDPKTLELFSTDIWSRGQRPLFVIAPGSLDELQRAVGRCRQAGVPLNPRGGGMSYTEGYTADRPGVGLLDMRRMNRILSIAEDDMIVTVEAGCTWKDLYEALAAKKLRTPFFGPLSGISSTIGGGVSQNNAFFGAGAYGPTADSVVALTVVLADGTVVRTGTAGTQGAKPFFRHYGPDLAGLFIGDAGAFGIKAEVTLRLIPMPQHEDYLSFEFTDQEACARALEETGRLGIAAEIFGFDPALTAVRMKRDSLADDAKRLTEVVRHQKGLLKGLREGLAIAGAGRSFIADQTWSLHLTVEGDSESGVRAKRDRLAAICEKAGGKPVANTIPKVIRASPFTPLNNMLGPEGERWVPIHGIVPMSEGPAAWRKIADGFTSMQADFDAHGVVVGFLVTTLSNNGFLIEPVFLWRDERYAVHDVSVEASALKKMKRFDRNDQAMAVVRRARKLVMEVFREHGAAHFQIGRTYPYFESRDEGTADVLRRLKSALDPEGTINPGALGLHRPSTPLSIRNPRTGESDGELNPLPPAQIEAQAAALRRGALDWARLSLPERGERLLALATSLGQHKDKIAEALAADTGRRRIAALEIDGVIASLHGWSAQIPHLAPTEEWITGRSNPAIKHRPQWVPYGLVGVISPWNFPLTLSMIDTVPALLAGAAVMVKPSEVTPRFIRPLQMAIEDAGLSDILAFIEGDGRTGAALIGAVDAVCFTGSVPTGRKVAVACAERLIPSFLELGGKDPLIVTASADLELATDAALRGSVLATGQACQSIERIYVHRDLHDRFLRRLTEKAEATELNWPEIGSGQIGPLIFDKQAQIIAEQLADAVTKGAHIHTGGTIEEHGGGRWLR
ncbi:MAG: aldehyde dehydrogenase family protein, partial [Parvularcula sp.]|nr:aldehyde dehydrogenase family protein [Parvularcula sp.]